MNSEQRHRRIGMILERVARASPEEQGVLIAELCGDDAELAGEVRSLLRHDDHIARRLETPVFTAADVLDAPVEVFDSTAPSIPGFRLQRLLGQGSSGVVYLAEQDDPRRWVAIKVLRPACMSDDAPLRMQAEAHLLARLEHPAIARVYQVGVLASSIHDQPFLVMEYVDGEPLSSFVQRRRLSLTQRIELVCALCEVVEYAHRRGVIHRDIKPTNVLVCADPTGRGFTPKIIDFGIAKLTAGRALPVDVQTIDARRLGTLRYMSPERRSGRSTGAAVTSDIYSLGVLAGETLGAHELIRERDPLDGPRAAEAQTPRPEHLPPAVTRVLQQMTARSPEHRHQTAQGAADDLRTAMSEGARTRRPLAPRSQMLRQAALVTCVLVLLVMGAAISLSPPPHSRTANEPQDAGEPQRALAQSGGLLSALGAGPPANGESTKDEVRAKIKHAGSGARVGNHEEALSVHRELAERFGGTILPRDERVDIAISQASVLLLAGRPEDARPLFQQVKLLLDIRSLNDAEAHRWRQVAHGLQTCGDRATASQMYERLIQHNAFGSLGWYAQSTALANYAGLKWLERDYRNAEKLFERALGVEGVTSSQKEQRKLAEIESSHGLVLQAGGRLEEAERVLSGALERFHVSDLNDEPVVWRLMHNLAINHLLTGKYQTAKILASSAREKWLEKPASWPYRIAEADFILGSAELGIGNTDAAIDALRRAREGCESLDGDYTARLTPRIDNALGAALHASGRVEQGRLLLDTSAPAVAAQFGAEHPWAELAAGRAP